ncbi:unnamed protein product [Diamesa serratosioi]
MSGLDHLDEIPKTEISEDVTAKKSDERSQELINKGDVQLLKGRYFNALISYNRALCIAIPDSENVGIAYANRSKVYLKMSFASKCLENIEYAIANKYPEAKLKEIKDQCLQIRNDVSIVNPYDKLWKFARIANNSHPFIPYITDCLTIDNDMFYNRKVVTTKRLKPGDVVAIEEPIFKILKADPHYGHCSQYNIYESCVNCLEPNLLSLIPCPSCNSAMFCSEQCRKTATKRYHQYECAIMPLLINSSYYQEAFRLFLEFYNDFDKDVNELMAFVLNQENSTATIFDYDLNEPITREKYRLKLTAVLGLFRTSKKWLKQNFSVFFQDHPELQEIWLTHHGFLSSFLHKLAQICQSNFHGIGSWDLKKKSDKPYFRGEMSRHKKGIKLFGTGCFLFCSLLNHSCAPNVSRIYLDNKMIIVVDRMIPSGGQLLDCYRSTYQMMKKQYRQDELLDYYHFYCHCEACYENYPLANGVDVISYACLTLSTQFEKEQPSITKDQVPSKYREYSDVLRRYKDLYRANEFCMIQDMLLDSFYIISKPSVLIP